MRTLRTVESGRLFSSRLIRLLVLPIPPRLSSHRKRHTAAAPHTMANPRRSTTGTTISEAPRPRQVMASKPVHRPAHRHGLRERLQPGGEEERRHPARRRASPRSRTTKIATRRVASGVRPSAASSRPNVDAMIARGHRHREEAGKAGDPHAEHDPREEERREQRHQREDGAADRLGQRAACVRDSGALRSRFHSPRWRSSRMPTASSMAAKSANWHAHAGKRVTVAVVGPPRVAEPPPPRALRTACPGRAAVRHRRRRPAPGTDPAPIPATGGAARAGRRACRSSRAPQRVVDDLPALRTGEHSPATPPPSRGR